MQPSSLVQDRRTVENLAYLKDLTRKTGALHEAQILHLKLWPRVVLPHCHASEVRVDTRKYEVRINAKVKGRKPARAKHGALLAELLKSVQWLLGAYWSVSIYENERLVAALARTEEVPGEKYAGTDFEAGRVVPTVPWHFPPPQPAKQSSKPKVRSTRKGS